MLESPGRVTNAICCQIQSPLARKTPPQQFSPEHGGPSFFQCLMSRIFSPDRCGHDPPGASPVPQPSQGRFPDTSVSREKKKVGRQAHQKAVDHRPDSKCLPPDQRAHRLRGHILQIIHDEGRADEQAAHADVQVKQQGPKNRENGSPDESGHHVAIDEAGKESGEKGPEPEGREKIANQPDGKSPGRFFPRTAQPEKPNGMKETGPLEAAHRLG